MGSSDFLLVENLLKKYEVQSEGLYPIIVKSNGQPESQKTMETNLRSLLADASLHQRSEIVLPRFLSK